MQSLMEQHGAEVTNSTYAIMAVRLHRGRPIMAAAAFQAALAFTAPRIWRLSDKIPSPSAAKLRF